MKHLAKVFCGVLTLLLSPMAAQATVLGFQDITYNSAADEAIGEAQLSVEVTDAGGGLVSFLFSNSGPYASSITDVYFDDGSLLGISQIIDSENGGSAGVNFSADATPPNLPGGNNLDPSFEATEGFSADSDAPASWNGVNPGEWLEILFDLQSGQTFADVESELISGALRIGIHVQGFDDEDSESFVATVPAPDSLALLAFGLLALAGISRRRGIHTLRSVQA
jgi:hypothetical protein